jgi:hypothetical protein
MEKKRLTAEEMKTDNELIAEFMGIPYRKEYGPFSGEEYTAVKLTKNANWLIAHYNKSWDWLMPVVEKIEDENPGTYFRIYRKKCIVRTMKSLIVFQKEVSATRIEAVYKAVVEFIKWWNENKKS